MDDQIRLRFGEQSVATDLLRKAKVHAAAADRPDTLCGLAEVSIARRQETFEPDGGDACDPVCCRSSDFAIGLGSLVEMTGKCRYRLA